MVELVRDPRASFASTNHQYVNSLGNMYGIHWGNYWRSVGRMARARFDWDGVFVFGFLLMYFYQAYLGIERQIARYPKHFMRVRNEDLNLNFAATTKSICDWLGVKTAAQWAGPDYVPTMVGRAWTGTGAYNSAYQTAVHGPLVNDSDHIARKVAGPNEYVTRRWRTRLAPHEIYLVEWVLRDEIERYGYDFVELGADNHTTGQFLRRLIKPLRGELPTLSWIRRGRNLGWREVADRIFFALSFPPFYIGNRLQFFRLMRHSKVFARV
jgi:hypothetical protein